MANNANINAKTLRTLRGKSSLDVEGMLKIFLSLTLRQNAAVRHTMMYILMSKKQEGVEISIIHRRNFHFLPRNFHFSPPGLSILLRNFVISFLPRNSNYLDPWISVPEACWCIGCTWPPAYTPPYSIWHQYTSTPYIVHVIMYGKGRPSSRQKSGLNSISLFGSLAF